MSSSVFANAVIEYGSFDSVYSEYYKMSWFAALTIGVTESALDDRSVVAETKISHSIAKLWRHLTRYDGFNLVGYGDIIMDSLDNIVQPLRGPTLARSIPHAVEYD